MLGGVWGVAEEWRSKQTATMRQELLILGRYFDLDKRRDVSDRCSQHYIGETCHSGSHRALEALPTSPDQYTEVYCRQDHCMPFFEAPQTAHPNGQHHVVRPSHRSRNAACRQTQPSRQHFHPSHQPQARSTSHTIGPAHTKRARSQACNEWRSETWQESRLSSPWGFNWGADRNSSERLNRNCLVTAVVLFL